MNFKSRTAEDWEQILKSRDWSRVKEFVDKTTDSGGKEIDGGIKDTVCVLIYSGFPTGASCEGHTDRGKSYPWVNVGFPKPGENHNDPRKLFGSEIEKKAWAKRNFQLVLRMEELVGEFYCARRVDPHVMIFPWTYHFGTFELKSIGAEMLQAYSKPEIIERSQKYKDEMSAFTEFLKEKFKILEL
jgi:hypothetical protein